MDFETAVNFHGHVCPGLSIGYRVATLSADHFKDRSKDEELVVIVENRSCAVDAIQVINGCTCGKGNLIFKDHGKHVYTYFKRGDSKALRISLKPDALPQDEKHTALFAKLRSGTASPEEAKEFRASHDAKSQKVLEMPEEELFWVREVEIKPPEKAIIYPTLICSKCGEGFMEPMGRIRNGKIVCIPCFEAKMNEDPETSEVIEMVPVGYVENDYLEPVYNEDVYNKVSKIVLKEEFIDGLYRIKDFEKLYILFYFSKSKGYKLIHRRRYDGEMSGIFASRSPYRPNKIGLTVVELLKVDGNILHVKGLDAINGTPVLDIKPYIKEEDE